MLSNETRIRRASPDDAERLSRFAAESFRDAFGAENTAEDMALYLSTTFTPALQAAEIADAASDILLAERPGDDGALELAGYAHLVQGAPLVAVHAPAPIELKRFYVSRRWHGAGLARHLLDEVVLAARERGARTLWLGVWERNPRAIAFYMKSGFAQIGTQEFLLGRDRQVDRVMTRAL